MCWWHCHVGWGSKRALVENGGLLGVAWQKWHCAQPWEISVCPKKHSVFWISYIRLSHQTAWEVYKGYSWLPNTITHYRCQILVRPGTSVIQLQPTNWDYGSIQTTIEHKGEVLLQDEQLDKAFQASKAKIIDAIGKGVVYLILAEELACDLIGLKPVLAFFCHKSIANVTLLTQDAAWTVGK